MAVTRSLALFLLLSLSLFVSDSGTAQASNSPYPVEDNDDFHWEVDLGVVLSQRKSVVQSLDKVNFDADLKLWFSGGAYYKNIFIESTPNRNNQLTLGYTLVNTPKKQINLITSSWFYPFSASDQKSSSQRLDGIKKRKRTSEVGLEYNTLKYGFDTQFRVLHDAFSVHNGTIINLNIGKSLFTKTFYIRPSIGLAYITQNATNYYYGIDADETTNSRSEYHPSGDWIAAARLYLDRPINEHWSFVAAFNLAYVGNEISRSPIVDSSYSYDINFGVLWAF
ncbi:MipA/OmpV family protein [Alteromonas sp. a30]|uniref:MipA/OmpV family protein n=1 Tax=Alteromonas sp. a30 TaxID=2730917 RepID=UPI00228126FA|nr:MipA/OmpV family protein [Alteromonas sp. a30]MCY7294783.1 MipA/OmpV family protein [Alteromonas sp. a30]